MLTLDPFCCQIPISANELGHHRFAIYFDNMLQDQHLGPFQIHSLELISDILEPFPSLQATTYRIDLGTLSSNLLEYLEIMPLSPA